MFAAHTTLPAMLLAAVVLTGCAQDDAATAPPVAGEQAAAEAGFNEADVSFLQGMIPHHSQAVEMAELVPDNTDRPELNQLSEAIVETQRAEIDRMNALLEQAGEEPVDPAMPGMQMGDGMQMPGMMDDAQMSAFMALRGQEFDTAFVDMMMQHHQGAIEAAERVLDEGSNPEVATLAQEIIEAQQAEIEQMQSWQQEWSS